MSKWTELHHNPNYAGFSYKVEISENGFVLKYRPADHTGEKTRVFSEIDEMNRFIKKTYGIEIEE